MCSWPSTTTRARRFGKDNSYQWRRWQQFPCLGHRRKHHYQRFDKRCTRQHNHGSSDAFLLKYNASGVLQWKKQYGTSGEDYITGVSLDDDGSMFVSGITTGNMGGTNRRLRCIPEQIRRLGHAALDRAVGNQRRRSRLSVALDDDENVFITGWTTGDMVGTNQGGADAFLIKLSPVPEPGSIAMLVGIAVMALLYWRRRA